MRESGSSSRMVVIAYLHIYRGLLHNLYHFSNIFHFFSNCLRDLFGSIPALFRQSLSIFLGSRLHRSKTSWDLSPFASRKYRCSFCVFTIPGRNRHLIHHYSLLYLHFSSYDLTSGLFSACFRTILSPAITHFLQGSDYPQHGVPPHPPYPTL